MYPVSSLDVGPVTIQDIGGTHAYPKMVPRDREQPGPGPILRSSRVGNGFVVIVVSLQSRVELSRRVILGVRGGSMA